MSDLIRQIVPPIIKGKIRDIRDQVQDYLHMPTQEEFDALVQAGWEREEAHFEAWQAQLRRERMSRLDDDLFQE